MGNSKRVGWIAKEGGADDEHELAVAGMFFGSKLTPSGNRSVWISDGQRVLTEMGVHGGWDEVNAKVHRVVTSHLQRLNQQLEDGIRFLGTC